jgi:hypothetical protein
MFENLEDRQIYLVVRIRCDRYFLVSVYCLVWLTRYSSCCALVYREHMEDRCKIMVKGEICKREC